MRNSVYETEGMQETCEKEGTEEKEQERLRGKHPAREREKK